MNCPLSFILLRKVITLTQNELKTKSQPFSVWQRTPFTMLNSAVTLLKLFFLGKREQLGRRPSSPSVGHKRQSGEYPTILGTKATQSCGYKRNELVSCASPRTHPEAWLFYFLSSELCSGRAKSYLSSEEIFHRSSFVENPYKCLSFFKCQVVK